VQICNHLEQADRIRKLLSRAKPQRRKDFLMQCARYWEKEQVWQYKVFCGWCSWRLGGFARDIIM
jgi:hypothetical protein